MIIPLKIKRKDKARLGLVLLLHSLIYQAHPASASGGVKVFVISCHSLS